MGERLGLAGTRPGEYQQRTGVVGYSLRLLGRQIREQGLGPGRRMLALARLGTVHCITS